MIEAVVALLLALLLVFVFTVGWTAKVAALGGVAFFIYVLILVIEWLVGKVKG